MKKIDGRTNIGNGQYIGMGNNSQDHQRCITKLIKKLLDFDVVPEVPVTVAGYKYIPDVVVFEDGKPILIIEICKNRGYATDYKKIKGIVESSKTISDAFVYNYENDFWVRYTIDNGYEEEVSYSELLDIDLNFS